MDLKDNKIRGFTTPEMEHKKEMKTSHRSYGNDPNDSDVEDNTNEMTGFIVSDDDDDDKDITNGDEDGDYIPDNIVDLGININVKPVTRKASDMFMLHDTFFKHNDNNTVFDNEESDDTFSSEEEVEEFQPPPQKKRRLNQIEIEEMHKNLMFMLKL